MAATILNNEIINTSMASSFNSGAIALFKASSFSIQLIMSGAPVGTLKLQFSSDATYDPGSVTNWDNIPNSSQYISEAGSHSWKVIGRYKWVRVVYNADSGTGACVGNVFAVEEF